MKIDKEKLPAPNQNELHYTKKTEYIKRMYNEVTSVKYKMENIDFINWVIKTFDEYYLNNKHITYAEYQKLMK